MRGPFLPIYGSGAIVMLVASAPFQSSILLTYISGVIGATLLEYITGVCMEALFKVRYWNYSEKPFNFQGHICLSSSVAWGFLTILMTHVIHRPIAHFVEQIPATVMSIVTLLLTISLVTDFAVSFRTAMDLRDILIRMEKGKEELLRMQRRLDVMIAVMENTKEEITEELIQKRETTKEHLDLYTEQIVHEIEERLIKVKNAIHERPTKYLDSIRDEVSELRGKLSIQSDNGVGKFVSDFHKRSLILGNPSMVSAKYNDLLDELKNEIMKRKKNHGKHKEDL